jgi:anti-sigma factor RsiW
MNCQVSRRWLDAYLDGELELGRQLDLEAHLTTCSACKSAVEEAVNFRSLVRANIPVYNAPPELKTQIEALLRKESS